jgi:hypothetical protein
MDFNVPAANKAVLRHAGRITVVRRSLCQNLPADSLLAMRTFELAVQILEII